MGQPLNPPEKIYLIRLSGELVLKSPRVRNRFQKILRNNISAAVKALLSDEGDALSFRIEDQWSRIYLTITNFNSTESKLFENIESTLKRIAGLQSFSPIDVKTDADWSHILAQGKSFFGPLVGDKRFAVKARRTGTHSFGSQDIQRELGAELVACGGKVDLTQPEITVGVEVRDQTTYMFHQVHKGFGGLPLGSGGRALCLFSGGIDSPVAAWHMMNRGIVCDFLYVSLSSSDHKEMVYGVAKKLAQDWMPLHNGIKPPRFMTIPFSEVIQVLRQKVTPGYLQVVLKRCFLRLGQKAINDQQPLWDALITGESLGQVSSQTLQNLRAIYHQSSLLSDGLEEQEALVLRPLIGMNKEQIIKQAEHIGSFDLSKKIPETCGLSLAKPVTAASLERLNQEEAKARADGDFIQSAWESRETRFFGAAESPPLKNKSQPSQDFSFSQDGHHDSKEQILWIDLRPTSAFEKWHAPGAFHMDWYGLMDLLENDKPLPEVFSNPSHQTYVLYCAVGMQSMLAVAQLRRRGFGNAFHFKGGVVELQKQLSNI